MMISAVHAENVWLEKVVAAALFGASIEKKLPLST
jgi:hypothetical protein